MKNQFQVRYLKIQWILFWLPCISFFLFEMKLLLTCCDYLNIYFLKNNIKNINLK
jgi:hypothetical protein